MELRTAQPHEAAAIRALLRDSGLPTEDLDAAQIRFVVAVEGERLLGVGGIEDYAPYGLLRSLAVKRDGQRGGMGTRLLHALEEQARQCGLRELVLLTMTAAPFFHARGYREIPRAEMPERVQASPEFRALCPASATCMRKPLEPSQ